MPLDRRIGWLARASSLSPGASSCLGTPPEVWPGVTRAGFLEALSAEGIPVGAGYPTALYANPVFHRPGLGRDYSGVACPNTERMCKEGCWIFHPALLGTSDDTDDIAAAVEKVRENAGELAVCASDARPCRP